MSQVAEPTEEKTQVRLVGKGRRIKIGIFGHVGTENMGDEAIITSVIQNVRDRLPDVDLVGFTTRPEDTISRHGIPACQIRRVSPNWNPEPQPAAETPDLRSRLKSVLQKFPPLYALFRGLRNAVRAVWEAVGNGVREVRFLSRSSANLEGVDLLLVSGSGQLSDYFGGPWGFPYTLYKWTMMARMKGCKIAFMSLGAGPIKTRLGKFFLRQTLRMANYRSYRDPSSKEWVERIGIKGNNPVLPDLAYSLRFERPGPVQGDRGRKTIAVNPIPYFAEYYWPERDPRVHESYISNTAAFVGELLDRDYEVILFPTQLRADPPMVQKVEAAVRERHGDTRALRTPSVRSLDELLALLAEADIIVPARFHGVLFSYLLGKPVIGVSYHQKTTDLMAGVGQADFAIAIREFEPQRALQLLAKMEGQLPTASTQILAQMQEFRRLLSAQYDQVVRLVTTTSPQPISGNVR